MRTTTSDLRSVIMSDESPAPLQRRSFFGRFGRILAGLLAGLPLIHGSHAEGRRCVCDATTREWWEHTGPNSSHGGSARIIEVTPQCLNSSQV